MIRVFDAMLAVCEAAGGNRVMINSDSPRYGLFTFERADGELGVTFCAVRRSDVIQRHTARFNNGVVHVTCLGSFDETGKQVVFRDGGQSEQVIVDFLREWLGQVKQ